MYVARAVTSEVEQRFSPIQEPIYCCLRRAAAPQPSLHSQQRYLYIVICLRTSSSARPHVAKHQNRCSRSRPSDLLERAEHPQQALGRFFSPLNVPPLIAPSSSHRAPCTCPPGWRGGGVQRWASPPRSPLGLSNGKPQENSCVVDKVT